MNSNFRHRYELFSGFTSTLQSDESFYRWEEYRAQSLYPVIHHLMKKITDTIFLLIRGSVKSLMYRLMLTFAVIKEQITGWESVYIWVSYEGPSKTDSSYPGFFKFSDEGGEGSKGNLLQYILNTESADQYEYFLTRVSNGLTNAGQARLNQSIEALVYCVLGAQVNVRSSILGNTGSAQEVRQEFLVLLEDAIKQPDISNSVQRFQLAVQEAKVKLDLAVSPGTWLMPSRMVINTESTIGYNNRLKRVKPSMKLGVNSDVNSKSVSVGIKHNLGKSKVLLPHTSVVKKVNVPVVKKEPQPDKPPPAKPDTSKHEINLAVLTVVVGGLAWYMFR